MKILVLSLTLGLSLCFGCKSPKVITGVSYPIKTIVVGTNYYKAPIQEPKRSKNKTNTIPSNLSPEKVTNSPVVIKKTNKPLLSPREASKITLKDYNPPQISLKDKEVKLNLITAPKEAKKGMNWKFIFWYYVVVILCFVGFMVLAWKYTDWLNKEKIKKPWIKIKSFISNKLLISKKDFQI